jgi:uncharacterized protein Yka (UPF0111/DUF47 family)
MISLQKLFGRDDEFFTLLEDSGKECLNSVQALKRVVNNRHHATLDDFIATRRKEKQINLEITTLIARVSVTALEREDIEELSNALYKIPKTTEKFAERFLAVLPEVEDIGFTDQIRLMEEATTIVSEMLRELRTNRVQAISEQNERLQEIEGNADKVMVQLFKELYSRKYDAVKVVILKDLYELLEKVIDRCRDAGNVISSIVLKNS